MSGKSKTNQSQEIENDCKKLELKMQVFLNKLACQLCQTILTNLSEWSTVEIKQVTYTVIANNVE